MCPAGSEDSEEGSEESAKTLVSNGPKKAVAVRKFLILQRKCKQSQTPIQHNIEQQDHVICAQGPRTTRWRGEQNWLVPGDRAQFDHSGHCPPGVRRTRRQRQDSGSTSPMTTACINSFIGKKLELRVHRSRIKHSLV
jgi:hypothetical protein